MKTKNCGYRNFLIRKEKDILELKDLINNYKPISQNDIAFLLEKLKKERNKNANYKRKQTVYCLSHDNQHRW